MAVAAPYLVRAGLPRLHRWLEPGRRVPPLDPADRGPLEEQMGAWVDAIIRRGHPLVRPGCLTRGVTLYYALRRAGDEVSLCFGVGDDAGTVAGHCWLDRDGEPLLERADPLSKFTEVVRLSPEGVTN
jgi:Transglutaminase-like superfamily